MRLGLFGKILIAFWLTLIALGATLMVIFEAGPSGDRPSARYGPSFLAMLTTTVERDGASAADAQRRTLPVPLRDQIVITRIRSRPALRESSRHSTRIAQASDGRFYAIELKQGESGHLAAVPTITLWGAMAAGLVFSIGLAWYLSRPMVTLRKGFQRLAQGDLAVRLADQVGHRGDELSDMAIEFDLMAERLGMLVTARDRLLNDISHELRTPLTRAQLAIALARQGSQGWDMYIERVEAELAKLDALVDELLALAREESGAQGDDDYFDPVWVTAKVVNDARLEAEGKSLTLEMCLPDLDEDERPATKGSARLFSRALDNVLRNAIRFSPDRSTVTITVEAALDPPGYSLTVDDRGPGVAPDLVDAIFEPFVRADKAGNGLGLAIASRIVRALGGSIACSNRSDSGLSVLIELPASPAPA